MGGFGSGRSGGGKATVEACRSLDVNTLRKVGVLAAGWSGGWQWTCDGERVASISIRGGRDRIVMSYRWRRGGSDWRDVEEPVAIRWSACRFGGERPFFRCPGVVNGRACGRKVVKLYSAGRYYLCRHCYGLSYASRNEDRWDRALRRANKIRQQLGGEPGTASLFPRRPKGMWNKTYERLQTEVIDAEVEADERLALFAARLSKLDVKKRGYWK